MSTKCVYCVVCKLPKAPYGPRMCDHKCSGYDCDLWPGETREEFGYPCSTTEDP